MYPFAVKFFFGVSAFHECGTQFFVMHLNCFFVQVHEVVVHLSLGQSYDPGNTAVLESVFLLKAPLPLNFFLDRYKGNVLCIQV